ncbi:hypothetical protein [Cytobacillus sp. S13-E01]|uniref:YqgU-like beta propeller domain-containing protein n=1 Tax=Cytobacillus sp. S13-E01 TaxID=3031326 RepID=UPI0031F2E2ED
MRVLFGFIFLIIVLTGCQSSHQLYEVGDMPYGEDKDLLKSPVPVRFISGKQQIQPLDINGEAFNTVGEWFDDESVLYVIDRNGGSDIYYYNLFSGKKELFYSTEFPIVTMKANENYSLFLIHTSGARNMAELIVLDKNGDKKYDWQINSFDLQYVWNPDVVDEVFVTAFLEDWTFNTFVLNVKEQEQEQAVKQYSIPEPFVQWLDQSSIAYMKWSQDEPSFRAPLYQYDFIKQKESLLLENIVYFATYKDFLLSISNDAEDNSIGVYRFYKPGSMEKLNEVKIPLLTDYSKWFVPYHEYVTSKKQFYTFEPSESASYDTYIKKFELVSYSIESEETEVILSKTDNLPINCSPNGYFCLYGYQFEKLIDINGKEIKELIKM